MKRDNWPVGDEGVRPAGPDDACFYCREKVGESHRTDCVIRKRTVVCRVTFEYVRVVPEDWEAYSIDFQMNESSSCSNNLLTELRDLEDRVNCLCDFAQGEYVREATADDEEKNRLYVEVMKS